MILRMTLAGVTHDLDMDIETVRLSEMRDLLTQCGWSWDDFRTHLGAQHPDAMAMAWWLACKRDGAPLAGKARDLDWAYGEMDWEAVPTAEEAAQLEGSPDAEDPSDPRPTSSDQTEPSDLIPA